MAANVNNYIAAGNAAVKNTFASLAAARDNAPKYDEIAKQGMKSRAEEKITAMRADAAVKEAQVKADTLLEKSDIKIDLNKSLSKSKKKTQFAGKIAAAGAVMATALMPAAEIIKPGTLDFSRSETRIREGLAGINKEIEGLGKPGAKPKTDTPVAPTAGATLNNTDGWGRMSRAIRFAEGTSGDKGYTTMFGGGQFSDMSRHPDTVVHTDRYSSAAAGAYQFMPATWSGAKSALGLQDFSRESQEKAGRYLTEQRDVNPDAVYTTKEEFGAAIDKLAPEWAGLPTLATGTSYYGQGGKTLDQLWSVYNQ